METLDSEENRPVRPPLDLAAHLLELCRTEEGAHLARGCGLRRLTPSPVDARLFFANPRALAGPGGAEVLERLAADPVVASARRKGATVSLRVTDDYVESLGRLLEAGDDPDLGRSDALSGQAVVVNYLNPNATKPLHIGHLRNVTIGNALAATLEAAGARVTRQCLSLIHI